MRNVANQEPDPGRQQVSGPGHQERDPDKAGPGTAQKAEGDLKSAVVGEGGAWSAKFRAYLTASLAFSPGTLSSGGDQPVALRSFTPPALQPAMGGHHCPGTVGPA